MELEDRLAHLEHFQQWMREHQSEAYAAFLRYGNRYEVEEPDPVEDSSLGLGMVGGVGDAVTVVYYLCGRLVRRLWRTWRRA